MKAVIFALFAIMAVGSCQFLTLPYEAHLFRSAPIVESVIPSGYVAATRGSLHTAPLPEGPFAASHHINTAPAPGTF